MGTAAILGVLLLLAPPASNWFWGVNGFLSIGWGMRVAVVAITAVAASLPLIPTRRARWLPFAAVMFFTIVAFPLREKIHFLGDTAARIGALSVFVQNIDVKPLIDWARQIHASPLDFVVDFLGPVGLARLGLDVERGVSIAGFALALVFAAGAYRTVSRLSTTTVSGDSARRELHFALTAALVLSGALEAFAGYAESAGILLAAAAWWWSELLAPLLSRGRAIRMAVAWLVLFLCHRLAMAMILPQLWRSLGPPLEGDTPAARRVLLILSVVAAALAFGTLAIGGGSGQVGHDLRELLSSARTPFKHLAPPSDVLNLVFVVAPLIFIGPVAAGWGAVKAAVRRPEFALIAVAALPLLPLATQVGASGLGLHRDWDANVLLGWTLTLGVVAILSRLEIAALGSALAVSLPVAALASLGWIAVNADEAASIRRVEALATQPPYLADSQRGQAFFYLSSWSMYKGRTREAAGYYERSYEFAPTANRGLLAARAWAMAGDLDAASRMIARVRAKGAMDSSAAAMADTLEAQISRVR